MTLSEMIKVLENIKTTFGDLEVIVRTPDILGYCHVMRHNVPAIMFDQYDSGPTKVIISAY